MHRWLKKSPTERKPCCNDICTCTLTNTVSRTNWKSSTVTWYVMQCGIRLRENVKIMLNTEKNPIRNSPLTKFNLLFLSMDKYLSTTLYEKKTSQQARDNKVPLWWRKLKRNYHKSSNRSPWLPLVWEVRALAVWRLASVNSMLIEKKLKPDKFFMGKPSQNYRVSLHNFTCNPT